MSRTRSNALAALVLIGVALGGPPAAAAPPLVSGQSADFNAWVRALQRRLIASVTRSHGFPRKARVVVSFSVDRDGSVHDVHDLSSSDPDPRYPRLSERVVGLAGPYPPVPASHGAPVHFAGIMAQTHQM